MTDAPFADQVALVTGGGTGIGLACARALAQDGATVVLAARNTERLAAAADSLRADLGGTDGVAGAGEAREKVAVSTIGCDVTDEASVAAACEHAAGLGRFSMVVANAGYGSASPFHLTTLDDWNGVIARDQSHRCVPDDA